MKLWFLNGVHDFMILLHKMSSSCSFILSIICFYSYNLFAKVSQSIKNLWIFVQLSTETSLFKCRWANVVFKKIAKASLYEKFIGIFNSFFIRVWKKYSVIVNLSQLTANFILYWFQKSHYEGLQSNSKF